MHIYMRILYNILFTATPATQRGADSSQDRVVFWALGKPSQAESRKTTVEATKAHHGTGQSSGATSARREAAGSLAPASNQHPTSILLWLADSLITDQPAWIDSELNYESWWIMISVVIYCDDWWIINFLDFHGANLMVNLTRPPQILPVQPQVELVGWDRVSSNSSENRTSEMRELRELHSLLDCLIFWLDSQTCLPWIVMQLLFHPGYVWFHARRGGMVLHRTFILWHGETELFFLGGVMVVRTSATAANASASHLRPCGTRLYTWIEFKRARFHTYT